MSPLGLAEHLLVGTAVERVCHAGHAAPWVALALVLGFGLWHEWMDGDFTTAEAAPWNGGLDVVFFVLEPACVLLFGR